MVQTFMSDADLKFDVTSTAGEIPDPQFFHNNLHHREVLATLRYGIEARKGLILFSGEAGTGKTTLINRLMQELDASVTCILESDSNADFTDLLRLIARHVHAESARADSLSAESCKALLREQRDQGRIICLIIDNAQHLDELTLEYLMETFFPANAEVPSAEEGGNHLLQVVLAGRPPLREKLLHPWLRPLNPHLGLVCHVEALHENDVASYADNQLRACRFPANLMDRQAIAPIISLTGGNPRLINDLCARAVQLADASPGHRITPETIANAAYDLGLSDAWRSRLKGTPTMDLSREQNDEPAMDFSRVRNGEPATDFSKMRNGEPTMNFASQRNERDETFSFESSEAETTDMLIQTFLQDAPAGRRRWFLGRGRRGTGTRVVLPLLLIGGIAIWMQRDVLMQHVADGTEQLKALSGWSEFSAAVQPLPEPPAETTDSVTPPVVPPMADAPARQENDSSANQRPVPQREKPDERAVPAADNFAQNPPKPSQEPPPAPARHNGQRPASENSGIRSKQIEAQVQRAIANRAIEGVEVSVIDGTAYLQGRVASERQKRAAERAANSVEGVKQVRSRIVVS
jgi:type II secretory pathway predicted ATPase ExeA